MIRKTDNLIAYKRTIEDYKSVIIEQGKALRKLNDRIRVKTSEISRLNQELGHLRRTIQILKLEWRNRSEGRRYENNRFIKPNSKG